MSQDVVGQLMVTQLPDAQMSPNIIRAENEVSDRLNRRRIVYGTAGAHRLPLTSALPAHPRAEAQVRCEPARDANHHIADLASSLTISRHFLERQH